MPDSPEQTEREAAINAARGTIFAGVFLPKTDQLCDQQECMRPVRIGTPRVGYLCMPHYEDALIAAARAAGRAEVEEALRDAVEAHDALLLVHVVRTLEHQLAYDKAYPALQAARALLPSEGAERG